MIFFAQNQLQCVTGMVTWASVGGGGLKPLMEGLEPPAGYGAE